MKSASFLLMFVACMMLSSASLLAQPSDAALDPIPLDSISLDKAGPQGTQGGGESTSVQGKDVAHWTGLPIGRADAIGRGFDLPLPLGVNFEYYYEDQPFEITSIKVGPIGGPKMEVLGFIQAGDAETKKSNYSARIDAWILPFLNVYGIVGYNDGKVEIDLVIPPVPPLGFSSDQFNLEYDGLVYGGGMTLAGGFKPTADRNTVIFGVADLNYTITDLNFTTSGVDTDSELYTFVFTARIGVRDLLIEDSSFGPVHGSIWVGTMFQKVDESLVGQFPALDLSFAIQQEIKQPWNFVFGGRVELGNHFELMFEAGLGERQSILVGAVVRF
jgi:hypothetical protein